VNVPSGIRIKVEERARGLGGDLLTGEAFLKAKEQILALMERDNFARYRVRRGGAGPAG
jgi:hypothetical protein